MAGYKTLKTKRVDPEIGVGESYDPATDVPRENFPAPPKGYMSTGYDIPGETRERAAFMAQLPEGRQFFENKPPHLRDTLTDLMMSAPDWIPPSLKTLGAETAGAVWSPLEDANYAYERGDVPGMAGAGAQLATNALLAKYGMPVLKRMWSGIKANPAMANLAAMRGMDWLGGSGEEKK